MAPKHSKLRVGIAGKLSTDREERSKKLAVLKKKRTELVKQPSELQHKQTADGIEGLEKEIIASPRGYNHIVKLLGYLKVCSLLGGGGMAKEINCGVAESGENYHQHCCDVAMSGFHQTYGEGGIE